jgi:adenosylcobinamide-phosphate synthase
MINTCTLAGFAAKLDDIANFIPARISAYLMIVAAWVLRYDFSKALRIYRRDRYNHTSPNSAHTEAVCAGALNIQLAGSNYYFGSWSSSPRSGMRGEK